MDNREKEKTGGRIDFYDIGVNAFSRQFRDPGEIIRKSREAGVACIVTGSSAADDVLVDGFVGNAGCWGTAGIHPHNASRAAEHDYTKIREILMGNPRVVAAGECGLDYDRMFSGTEDQKECLRRQMDIAEELGVPMFLHMRDADDDFIRMFKDRRELASRSVVHCFTGGRETVLRLLELGFSIGVTGWICDDRRAEPLRRAVPEIPLDRIMIETDSPYLVPRGVPGLGHVNYPWNIRYVCDALAGYMKVERTDLMKSARQNTEKLFGLAERK
ncbi:MAG: TatD family hydrolase [Oscillospiraceae bacterium]|jgi:TatD DNase family protein